MELKNWPICIELLQYQLSFKFENEVVLKIQHDFEYHREGKIFQFKIDDRDRYSILADILTENYKQLQINADELKLVFEKGNTIVMKDNGRPEQAFVIYTRKLWKEMGLDEDADMIVMDRFSADLI